MHSVSYHKDLRLQDLAGSPRPAERFVLTSRPFSAENILSCLPQVSPFPDMPYGMHWGGKKKREETLFIWPICKHSSVIVTLETSQSVETLNLFHTKLGLSIPGKQEICVCADMYAARTLPAPPAAGERGKNCSVSVP